MDWQGIGKGLEGIGKGIGRGLARDWEGIDPPCQEKKSFFPGRRPRAAASDLPTYYPPPPGSNSRAAYSAMDVNLCFFSREKKNTRPFTELIIFLRESGFSRPEAECVFSRLGKVKK